MRIGYVTTGYPYVSHTFIQNEVLGLRELGAEIKTFALTRAPDSECRTPADREALETTYALRPPQLAHYVRGHLTALVMRPSNYFRTLRRTLAMAGTAPADIVRHFAYFLQGVVLWNRCAAAGITHVHAHFANVSSDVALLAAMVGGDRWTWSFTMHGPTEFYDVRHHRLSSKVTDAAFVICISDFARSQLMGIVQPEHWSKLHIVHCGVDLDRFAPVARTLNNEPVRVACVGRLVPEKGQALLIEALAALRRHGHELRLTLVGDGPQRDSLERLARSLEVEQHVEFTGAVAPGEVEQVLRGADIFCLPSFAEGVPVVLMEAMAMQLPVVASRVMGIPELIDDQVSGRLVRPGSSDELVLALESLAEDPDARAALGRAGRAKVASDFELRSGVRQLYERYAEYLGV